MITGARTAPLLPRTIAGLLEPEDPQLSPDGRLVSFTLRSPTRSGGYQRAIWVCSVDGTAARQVSAGGRAAHGARWSPAGDRLAWIRDAGRGARIEIRSLEGDERNAESGELPDATDLAWSPAGTEIAFTGRTERAGPPPLARRIEGLAYKGDGEGVVTGHRALQVLTLEGGAVLTVARASGRHFSPMWSPDGRWLAVGVKDPGGYRSQLHVISIPSGDAFVVGTPRSAFPYWAWSPDSSRILLVGGLEHSFHPGIAMVSLASREVRTLIGEPRCLVVDHPVWREPDAAILHGRERARSALYRLSLGSGELTEIGSRGGGLWGLSSDAAGRQLVAIHGASSRPPEVTVFHAPTGAWTTVTDLNARALSQVALGVPEAHTIRSDDLAIDYWLLRPAALEPGSRAPAIVIVHGGPQHDVGDDWELGTAQCLASHGFVVAWANARGSTSYGRAFAHAVNGDYGGGELRDLLAVVADLQARADVDPSRLGICGGSHGGYMTAWAIANTDVFRAAVCMSPVFDLLSEWGMSDEGHNWGELVLLGSPLDRPESYRERSPSSHAWHTRAATLILHGERDERCPIGQSELMFSILRSAGCEVEFVRYPQAAHDLMESPAAIEDVSSRILGWFRHTLASDDPSV